MQNLRSDVLDKLNIKVEMAVEKNISELEDRAIEIIQFEKQTKRLNKRASE